MFRYTPAGDPVAPSIQRPGYGHIAFSVPNVGEARAVVVAHGGSPIGEVVQLDLPNGNRVGWCYVSDSEGNGIELQTWL